MTYLMLHNKLLEFEKNPEVYQPYLQKLKQLDAQIKTYLKKNKNQNKNKNNDDLQKMLTMYRKNLIEFEKNYTPPKYP